MDKLRKLLDQAEAEYTQALAKKNLTTLQAVFPRIRGTLRLFLKELDSLESEVANQSAGAWLLHRIKNDSIGHYLIFEPVDILSEWKKISREEAKYLIRKALESDEYFIEFDCCHEGLELPYPGTLAHQRAVKEFEALISDL